MKKTAHGLKISTLYRVDVSETSHTVLARSIVENRFVTVYACAKIMLFSHHDSFISLLEVNLQKPHLFYQQG